MTFNGIAVPPRNERANRRTPMAAAERPVLASAAHDDRASSLSPSHRYGVGATLFMARGGRDIARQASTCRVVARLPHEGGPLRYRVRSDSEGFERIVEEGDLSEPHSAAE